MFLVIIINEVIRQTAVGSNCKEIKILTIMKYKKQQEWFLDNEQELATIPSRIVAMLIDIAIIVFIFYLISKVFDWIDLGITNIKLINIFHIEIEAKNMSESKILVFKTCLGFVPIIYFALTTYITNGQSIGKKVLGIKIISIYHHRIALWHCIERSLGYVASTLELMIGFYQVFWNPNRMTLHDRIAETIVIKTRFKKKNNVNTTTTNKRS
jgi:uncharacterized RDD family membrane protein YckC